MRTLETTIRRELLALMSETVEFTEKVKEAKTTTKKDYYTKKRKENNQRIAQLLIALQKLEEKGTDGNTNAEQING